MNIVPNDGACGPGFVIIRGLSAVADEAKSGLRTRHLLIADYQAAQEAAMRVL